MYANFFGERLQAIGEFFFCNFLLAESLQFVFGRFCFDIHFSRVNLEYSGNDMAIGK